MSTLYLSRNDEALYHVFIPDKSEEYLMLRIDDVPTSELTGLSPG